jgi:hypothetical protein
MSRRSQLSTSAALLIATTLALTGCANEIRAVNGPTTTSPQTSSAATAESGPTGTTPATSTDVTSPQDTAGTEGALRPHDGDYAAMDNLLETWEAATGMGCDGRMLPFEGSEETYLCEDDTIINWYASQDDLFDHVDSARESMVKEGMYREWVIGDNWSVRPEIGHSVDMTRLSALLGGFTIGLGDIEDKEDNK